MSVCLSVCVIQLDNRWMEFDVDITLLGSALKSYY